MLYIGARSWSNRRLGTVGIALPQVKLRIIDPATLKELPTDTDGEVRTVRTSRTHSPIVRTVQYSTHWD